MERLVARHILLTFHKSFLPVGYTGQKTKVFLSRQKDLTQYATQFFKQVSRLNKW